MTETTIARTNLPLSELVLVNYTGTEKERGVYFASRSDYRDDWATLIIPESDPRHRGMWRVLDDKRSFYGIPESDTAAYFGWNIPPRDFAAVVESPEETPEVTESREVEFANQLRKGDVFRIGSGDTVYIVTGDSPDGRTQPIVWGPNSGDRLDDWRGPATPSVRVSLVPHGAQSDWVRGKVAEILATPETGDSVPEVTEETPVTLTPSELAAQLAEAKASGKREAEAVFESWKESANRTAIAYANENSLCSEFDRCMRDIGMLDRDQHREEFPEEYDREYTVTVTYQTTVMAHDDESAVQSARENVDSYTIRHYGDWEAEEGY